MKNKFSKESLIKSPGFQPIERDILSIKLVEGQTYTKAEAMKIIKEFKGGI